MNGAPCIDPLPRWIQNSAVMILLLLIGACFGFNAGILVQRWNAKFWKKLFGAKD